MNLVKIMSRNWLGGLIGALLAAGLGMALDYFPFGHGLVNRSYDLLFYPKPISPPDDIRMIYMDDKSYQMLDQPLNEPWDRSLHTLLLDRLKADHARSIILDILFSDPSRDTNSDQAFANAIQSFGTVVLAADSVSTDVERVVDAKKLVLPCELFRTTNVWIANDEMPSDDDLFVRRFLKINPLEDQLEGMAWTTAQALGAPITKNEKSYDHDRWVNYYGPPLTLPSVPYYRVLVRNGEDDSLPEGYFSNKVVFVGSGLVTRMAGERKDQYLTPYSYWLKRNQYSPGMEAHATMCLNLLRGDWIRRAQGEIYWIGALGLLLGFGLAQFRPLPAVGVAMLSAALIMVISYEFFVREYLLFSWLMVVGVEIPVALLWSVVFNSVQLYVQNKLYEQSLKMYLSPKLVKKFASEKDLLKVGAKKQMLTICFTDIANFTSISEGLDGDELADLMNKYFQAAVSNCIHQRDGTIVKYIGDAIFAFWNAPDSQTDHALRACEAALLFREQPIHYVRGKALITRLGLHTGEANVGNFGSTSRVDYTALGENINLASRMEGLNKYLGTLSLLTGETHAAVAGKVLTRLLGRFQLKGFEKAVDVHELAGPINQAEKLRPLHEAFAAALKLFHAKDLTGAEAAFRKVLEMEPNDGPAKFYLKFLAELPEHPLPDDWNGEIELKEK